MSWTSRKFRRALPSFSAASALGVNGEYSVKGDVPYRPGGARGFVRVTIDESAWHEETCSGRAGAFA